VLPRTAPRRDCRVATRAAPGQQQLIPAKTDDSNGLAHASPNPHGYWARTAQTAKQPNPILVDKNGSCLSALEALDDLSLSESPLLVRHVRIKTSRRLPCIRGSCKEIN
jgi:hypothetical protein